MDGGAIALDLAEGPAPSPGQSITGQDISISHLILCLKCNKNMLRRLTQTSLPWLILWWRSFSCQNSQFTLIMLVPIQSH